MPVAVLVELEGVTPEMYDAVNAEMDTRANPPEGMIFHSGGIVEGGMRVYDVWESEDAYNRFEQSTLGPAVNKVSSGQAPEPAKREIYELHDFIKA
jgi:hypothetical protein